MSFWKIAWRNMQQRGLASTLTGLNMALGVAVMVCVIVIHSVAVRQFSQDAQGYHLIVGSGKGSPLELVMSTVFHISKPLYPIPYTSYRDFTDGKYSSITEVAVPYCLGDSFVAGDNVYRVIGTTTDLFDKIQYGTSYDGEPLFYKFTAGENFKVDRCFQAVIGSVVAAQSGLKVGDRFNPTHGIGPNGDKHDAFEIVGILDSTGTANDRAVFVNIEGFYLLEGHALSAPADESNKPVADIDSEEAAEAPLKGILPPTVCYDNDGNKVTPLPESQREVTSILVLCNSQFGPNILLTKINKDNTSVAQAVPPGGIVASMLANIIQPIQVILLVMTVLIILVASIGILVSIYNSMSERSHDIAVMRALGGSRTAVMMIVLFESILLALLGGLAGIVLGHLLVGAAAPYVEAQTGIRLAAWEFDRWEAIILPALLVVASLVGFLPALSAYRTDVAQSLSR